MLRRTLLGAILALALPLLPGAAGAQIAPNARWQTLESEHFRVTFGPGLESLARHAARRAEVAHARLASELAAAPAGKIDILLTDDIDRSNGMATPLPSNRITLYARPPVSEPSLAFFEDWIDLVVTHELAHIFHLDLTGRLGRELRALFGRVPAPWPFFPALGTPQWSIEGLATYIESRFTGAGRVHGSYHDMVLRTAILEGGFESIDQMSGPGATWPGGARRYIYGSLFLDYLSQRYGAEVQKRLVRAAADTWLPSLRFDGVAKKAMGGSFTSAYADWQRELEARYGALKDSLAADGLTPTERVGEGGYYAFHPRVAPDGRITYAALDGKSSLSRRIIDPATGDVRTLSRLNDLGPAAWLPSGSLLFAQVDFSGPYRALSDLYLLEEGREKRLTHGARLTEPDVAQGGRRVVAVQAGQGTNRLVSYDLGTGALRPLTPASPDVHWAFPRWSPDGARIAVGRWRRGVGYDVVVLDSAGTLLHEVTADRAIDMAPAWSPDGRYLLFSSDRSGITNLYAYDLAPIAAAADAPPPSSLRQVTNLLTGAFFPDISPDGRWIYFSGYHADGFHIERIPFDPSAWREPAPLRALALAGKGTELERGWDGEEGGDLTPSRPYSALATLRPYYWTPYWSGGGLKGTSYGAQTGGEDLVGRHGYDLMVAYQSRDRLLSGRLGYRYAGLGNPVLSLSAGRQWDAFRLSSSMPAEARMLEREDVLRLSASLLSRHIRSAAALTLGAEGVARARSLRGAPGYTLRNPEDRLAGVVVQGAFANYQAPPLSISLEDGLSLSITGRRRWDLRPGRAGDGTPLSQEYDELAGQLAAYKSLPLPGFAHHVLAARGSARWRQGPGASLFGVGGASGSALDLGVDQIGGGYRFLPLRGFPEDVRFGTRAWSATLEYRFPLALIERGYRLWPFFLDRLSGALFLDAAHAWCTAGEQAHQLTRCGTAGAAPLAAAGAELGLDTAFFFDAPFRLRGGVALPLQGAPTRPTLYFTLGHSF
jgi:hypothetical protein